MSSGLIECFKNNVKYESVCWNTAAFSIIKYQYDEHNAEINKIIQELRYADITE